MFSTAEAILCGNYTPLGQVQIGPIDSLGGQLAEYQIPSGIISTLKLADLAVTVDKLGISSVNDSKVAAGAGIVESKLSLDVGTSVLDALISANVIDIASNLALILLREETANKDVANGYLGLDATAKVPLSKLNPLTNAEIAVAAAIAESKLSLAFGTSTLNTDIQTRQSSSEKGVANGYCDLDASVLVPLSRLSGLTNAEIAVAAAIIESKLSLTYGTQALHNDIQTRALQATYAAHDHSAADPTQVDHANLLNVLTDQHHAQAHTLASHSTKAHSELSGIGANDHHTEFIKSTNFDKHVFLPAQAMSHRGTWGSWGNCQESGLGIVGREMTPAAGDCGYIEGGFYVRNFQATTATLKIWYAYEGAGPDAGTLTLYASFHNIGDSGWNLKSASAETFNWTGNHVLRYNYFSLSDADLSGDGWFGLVLKFSGMDAVMHDFVGVTLEYTTDHE